MKLSNHSFVRSGKRSSACRSVPVRLGGRFRKACSRRFRSQELGLQPFRRNARTCIEGPFGEVVRKTGAMAKANPFRFSTKYQDDETDLLYYGYRYFDCVTGDWLSRDLIAENGGANLHVNSHNNLVDSVDNLGLNIVKPIDAYLKKEPCDTCGDRCRRKLKKCRVELGPSYSPAGSIRAQPEGRSKMAEFSLEARFVHDPANNYCAGCCEVRQYLKWSSDSNAPNGPQWAPASAFAPNTYYEDRDVNDRRYGHRDNEFDIIDGYEGPPGTSNQLCGTRYWGFDRPRDASGKKTGFWTFKLEVIDVCPLGGGRVVASAEVQIQW